MGPSGTVLLASASNRIGAASKSRAIDSTSLLLLKYLKIYLHIFTDSIMWQPVVEHALFRLVFRYKLRPRFRIPVQTDQLDLTVNLTIGPGEWVHIFAVDPTSVHQHCQASIIT